MLRKIPRELTEDCELLSCDIVSLYTSIPHELGLEALNYWLHKCKYLIPPRFSIEFILDAARFILCNNNFYFDEQMYLQLIGTAMGTDFAPNYACLTIGFLEETKLYPQLRTRFSLEESKIEGMNN